MPRRNHRPRPKVRSARCPACGFDHYHQASLANDWHNTNDKEKHS